MSHNYSCQKWNNSEEHKNQIGFRVPSAMSLQITLLCRTAGSGYLSIIHFLKMHNFFPYKSMWIWFRQHNLYGIAYNLSYSHILLTHTYWAWNPLNQFTSSEQILTLALFLETLQLFSCWLHQFRKFLFINFLLWKAEKSTNLLLTFTVCMYTMYTFWLVL